VLAILACLASFGCSEDPASVPAAGLGPAKAGRGEPTDWVSIAAPFTAGLQVRSFAMTPARLVVSTVGAATSKLVGLDESGAGAPFAPAFAPDPEAACHLDISTGAGGWVPELFASAGTEIWQMPLDGTEVRRFATLPLQDDDIAGLCFDHAGGFGHDLLALTALGQVYRIGPQGRAARLGQVPPGARGPCVASMGFGPRPGQLLVAVPERSEVWSLDAAGNAALLLRWSGVAGVFAVPEAPEAYGRTQGAFFLATASGQVLRYPLRDLAGRGGQLVLTSLHRSGSGLVTPEGPGFRLRTFARFLGPEVAAGFVRRGLVTRIRIDITPYSDDNTIVLGSQALVPVGLMASIDFTPSDLDGGNIVLAGAQPVSRGPRAGTFVDLNRDGQFDLLLQFRTADLQLQAGPATVVLDGTTLSGVRVRGSDLVTVLAP
jgi:hypothetical protein